MERALFLCPTTRKNVDIGVETEIRSLLASAAMRSGMSYSWKLPDLTHRAFRYVLMTQRLQFCYRH
jgi:hypothetical protein